MRARDSCTEATHERAGAEPAARPLPLPSLGLIAAGLVWFGQVWAAASPPTCSVPCRSPTRAPTALVAGPAALPNALTEGFQAAFMGGAAIALAGLLATLLLIRGRDQSRPRRAGRGDGGERLAEADA